MSLSLKSHLQIVALVELPHEAATEELVRVLSRFGVATRQSLERWVATRDFIVPLRSMPTRYVLAPVQGWTLIVTNMRFESGHVDALAISRNTGCTAVSAHFMDESRHFHLVHAGQEIRDVVCYKDGSKWFFAARGEPQPWERTGLYRSARIPDRFTPEMATAYVEAVTGIHFPLAWHEAIHDATGIERSTKDVKVPIATFDVVADA
jgi:hypothetical protein